MSLNGRLLCRGVMLCGSVLLAPSGAALAQSMPQVVANPYCAPSATAPVAVAPTPYIVTPSSRAVPPAEFALRTATALPQAAVPQAAANSAAALSSGHVVYPAATNVAAYQPAAAVNVATAPVDGVGLPRNRVAALGAAMQVTTLRGAYRADVAAVEAPRAEPRSIFAGLGAAIEPPRFAPASNAAPLTRPSDDRYAAASTTPSTTPPTTATAAADERRDSAVRPVVWLSDLATSKNGPNGPRANDGAATGNPLRRELAGESIAPTGAGNALIGNPLR